MDTQTITTSSGERLVVISEAEYTRLIVAAEDASDRATVDAFRRDLASGDEELIPSEVVDRLLDGESRIKVWREYRGMTAAALADVAGITQPFLSQLETGKRSGTIETLSALAAAMGLAIQDLVIPPAYAQIKALLAEHPRGLTVKQMATELGYSVSHVRASCTWLAGEGKLEKRGARFLLARGSDQPPP